MIGNDIVDLQAAKLQGNPLRPRFLNKVFTINEQSLIKDSKNPEDQAWILWAMKEAAYKAHQRRLKLPRTLDPKKLQCEIWKQDSVSVIGGVFHGIYLYHAQVSVNPDFVHCTASAFKNEHIYSGIHLNSMCSKTELINKFSAIQNTAECHLEIVKDQHQVPYFSVNSKRVHHPFSLSHHGNFSAFSLALMNY